MAFVVPSGHGDVGEAELIAHCREYLAGYKKPSAIVVVGELPRNAGGKVLKRVLRETYRERSPAVRE